METPTRQSMFCFSAFGLRIRSCLPLPGLLSLDSAAAPIDIEIVYDIVPRELPEAQARGVRFQVARDQLLLQVDGVAEFLVENGRRITIARHPAADDDDVRTFLLGSVFGALMHQRDDLVLHGSAVAFGNTAIVFLGRSGAGKSTLAAALWRRGRTILTDELCVVRPDFLGRMLIYPGLPTCKLWLDSLEHLDFSPEKFRPIRRNLEKRTVPLGKDFATSPLRVRKLYVLASHNKSDLELTSVEGVEKFIAVKGQTYRFGFLAGIDDKVGHFQSATRLAQHAEVAILTRSRDGFRLDELMRVVEDDLGKAETRKS